MSSPYVVGPIGRLLLSTAGLGFFGIVLGASGMAAEETPKAQTIGLGKNANATYSAKVVIAFGGNEHKESVSLRAFRGDGADVALLVKTNEDTPQAGSPLLWLTIGDDGRAEPSVRTGFSLLATLAPEVLYFGLPQFELKPGARWTGEEPVRSFAFQGDAETEHSVSRVSADGSDDERLRVVSRIVKTKDDAGGAVRVTDWERTVVLDATKKRPTSIDLKATIEFEQAGTKQSQTLTAQITEETFKQLGPEEQKKFAPEFAALTEVVSAFQQQIAPGAAGVLGGLKRAKNREEFGDPVEMLAAFSKKYPDGVFAGVVDDVKKSMTAHLEMAKQQQRAEQTAAEMLNNPAPDFTLKDLEGKDVSLSDYKGKTVMLAFWGYG